MSVFRRVLAALRFKPVTSRVDGGLSGTGSDESARLTSGAANALVESDEGEYEFAPSPPIVIDTRTQQQRDAGQIGTYSLPANIRYRMNRGSRLVARGTRVKIPHISAGPYPCLDVEAAGQVDIGRVKELSLPWFGSKTTGDGITDDSATFQKWADALAKDWATYGSMFDTIGRAWIPPASSPSGYRISQTIMLNRPTGVTIEGSGGFQTLLQWVGGADVPVFVVQNALRAKFSDFAIVNQTAGRPSAMIEVRGHRLADPANPFGSSRAQFERIWLGGTTGADRMRIGILYSYADTDEEMAEHGLTPDQYYGWYNYQNDQGYHRCVHIVSATEAAVQLGTVGRNGSNMMSFSFDNCTFVDGQAGVRVYQGQFNWRDGYVANHSIANFHFMGLQPNAPVTIQGCNSEGSAQFLRLVTEDYPQGSTQGLLHPWAMTVEGCRVETEGLPQVDSYLIETESSGPLIFRGNHFGHPTDNKAPRFRHKVPYSQPTNYWTDLSVRYENNVFHSCDSNTGYGTLDYDPIVIESPEGVSPAPFALHRSGNLYRKIQSGQWLVRLKPAEEGLPT